MKAKLLIIIIIFIYPCFQLISEDRDSLVYGPSNFEKFLERVNYSPRVDNRNLIALSYGYHSLSYPHKDIFSNLSNVFSLDIIYGFQRIEEEYRKSQFLHLSSETIFLSNISSHMTVKDFKDSGKTTDAWKFGFRFTNGYGQDIGIGNLVYTHTGGINWIKIDFENLGESRGEQEQYDIFDTQYRFGTEYLTGLRYLVTDDLSLELNYSHSQHFPKVLFGKWFTSSTLELLIQRTIDYVGVDYFDEFGTFFPFSNWAVKNLVSLLFYELRRSNMNFPYSTEPSLNYDGIKMNLTFGF